MVIHSREKNKLTVLTCAGAVDFGVHELTLLTFAQALLTLAFMPILLFIVWCADNNFWRKQTSGATVLSTPQIMINPKPQIMINSNNLQ